MFEDQNKTRSIRAVVVSVPGQKDMVLYHDSLFLEEMILGFGNDLEELGLCPAPEGISVWEGKYHWCSNGYEDPEGGDWDPRGSFRSPTEKEWEAIRTHHSPWVSANEFVRLRDAHGEEQRFLSWVNMEEPNLLRIISMGMPVVPLIKEDMERPNSNTWSWFYALKEILKDGPEIPESMLGRTEPIKQLWLAWLTERGF